MNAPPRYDSRDRGGWFSWRTSFVLPLAFRRFTRPFLWRDWKRRRRTRHETDIYDARYEMYVFRKRRIRGRDLATSSVYFHDESFRRGTRDLPLVESSGTRISNCVMYFLNGTSFRNFAGEMYTQVAVRVCTDRSCIMHPLRAAYRAALLLAGRRGRGKRQHYVNVRRRDARRTVKLLPDNYANMPRWRRRASDTEYRTDTRSRQPLSPLERAYTYTWRY